MPTMRSALPLVLVLVVALPATPLVARADVVEVGVGAIGGAGIIGLGKPSNTTSSAGGVTTQDATYPGFFGSAVGAGASVDVRFFGFVGFEADLLATFTEKASGDLTVSGTKYELFVGQPAVHLPLLAKGILPLGAFRPFAAVGPEIVLPGTSSAEVTPLGLGTAIASHADRYAYVTVALGVEISLPIPTIDLRVPIALRGSFNPGTSDAIDDRRDVSLGPSGTVSRVTYRTEWQYQGALTVGLTTWF